MRRWRETAVGGVLVVLLVVAIGRLIVTNGPETSTPASRLDELAVPSAGVVRWSPDATKLAFIVNGQLVIVRIADAKELGRTGANVVDAAWMPDATRVVAVEGPIPTGQIVAVTSRAEGAGATPLRPSLAFGQGSGLSVNAGGTAAAAIATRRSAVGGATQSDLAVIDLQSGATRVFETEDREESNPVFVDDETIAYASQRPGGQLRLHVIDLLSGRVGDRGVIHDGPFGTLPSGEIVVAHRAAQGRSRLDAVTLNGETRVLGVTERFERPVAVDRFGTRVLVRRFGPSHGSRLRIEALSG